MEHKTYRQLKQLAQRTVNATVAATLVATAPGTGAAADLSPEALLDQGPAAQLVEAVKNHNLGKFPSGKAPEGVVTATDVSDAIDYLKDNKADCAILGAATRHPKTGAISSGLVAVERQPNGDFAVMQTKAGHIIATGNGSDTYAEAFSGLRPETNLKGAETVKISAQGYNDPFQCRFMREMAEKNVPGVYVPPGPAQITPPVYKEPATPATKLQTASNASPQGKFSVRGGSGGISFT